MRRQHQNLLATLRNLSMVAFAIVLGCSGSGGGGGSRTTTSVGGSDILPDSQVGKGKVGKRLSLVMTTEMYTAAKGSRATYPNGTTFDDATNTVSIPPLSLQGVTIYADRKPIGSTDISGNVRLFAVPPDGSDVEFQDNLDQPFYGKISAAEFIKGVKSGQIILPITVDETQNLATMDSRPVAREEDQGCGLDCGKATFSGHRVTSPSKCCLDYDGGVPPAGSKQCDTTGKLYHYQGSTCNAWVWMGVCGHGWQRFVNPGATDAGVCSAWHQGRFCDDIDDDAFEVTDSASSHGPSRKVNVGDTVTFTVLNNTRDNETMIQVDKGSEYGSLTAGAELVTNSPMNYTLKHYDATPTWFQERTVTYTAALPSGVDEATVAFTFGKLHPQTISIKVCH